LQSSPADYRREITSWPLSRKDRWGGATADRALFRGTRQEVSPSAYQDVAHQVFGLL